MKTLYVVRHAKSDWSHADVLRDIDRPLNKRGVRNAYEMSARLTALNIKPDAIVSSNGIRALHTAIIFAHQLNFNSKKIVINSALYHASANEILDEIQNINDTADGLMIFGHNPGLSDFVSYLNHSSYLQMPTCAIASFKLAINHWSEMSFDVAELSSYDFPKNKAQS